MKKCRKIFALLVVFSILASMLIPFEAGAETNGSEVIVDVTDFGADPTGAADSAVAIQNAIAYAKELSEAQKDVTLYFPNGRYDIYPDKAAERVLYTSNTVGTNSAYTNKKIGVLLEDVDNVTVDGGNSLFMFHGLMTTFAAIRCENVSFKNFTVNFQVPTVMDITVDKVSGQSAICYIPECYNYSVSGTNIIWTSDISPYTGRPYWTKTNSMNYTQRYNTVTGLTYRADETCPLFRNLTSIEDLGNRRVKFNFSSMNSEIAEGLCYQMRVLDRDHPGAFIWESKDVSLRNLDVQFIHGFGILGQLSENITIDSVDFETDKSRGTTTAGYADFIHISGCKGFVDIGNCTYSNPHDDPINIHGTFLQLVEKISDKKIRVRYMHRETAGFPNYYVGDEIQFARKSNMLSYEGFTATVTAVDGPDGMGGNMGEGSGSLTDIILTLDKSVPADVTVNNFVVDNITYSPDVYIHDNTFKETPTRGVLCTSSKHVVIENNTFDGMGMAGIFISDDANNWYESTAVKDVTIRNNTFVRGKAQAIFIQPIVSRAEGTVHRNITIEGNTFYANGSRIVDALSTDNLIFKNNVVYRENPGVGITASAANTNMTVGQYQTLNVNTTGNTLSTSLFSFNYCTNVKLEDNSYDGGLNVSSSLSNMSSNDITVINDPASAAGSASSITPVAGTIRYKSSNENVIAVSSNGTVTAVGAGTATVSVYSVAAGKRYDGNSITFTVTDGSAAAATGINITTQTELITAGSSLQYEANVTADNGADTSVSWSVVNAQTGAAAGNASMSSDGLLTTTGAGLVEVIARTANGLEDRQLLSVTSNDVTLADNFEVVNEDSSRWSISSDNLLTLRAKHSGLWQSDQTPANVVLASFDFDMTNAEAVVKLTGKTKTGWDDAGLVFYTNDNNYVAVQRKHNNGSPTINLVTEANAVANEDNKVNDPGTDVVYLKLVKENNSFTAYYKTDGDWTQIGSAVSNTALGASFKIGMVTGSGGSDTNTEFVFSEFTVNGSEVPMAAIGGNASVNEASVIYNESEATLSAQYSLSDSDARAVIRWEVADTADGDYSLIDDKTANLTVTSSLTGKYVKAVIVPVSALSTPFSIFRTNPVQITGETVHENAYKSSNAALSGAEITGLSKNFAAFNSNTVHYRTTADNSEKQISFAFTAVDENADVAVYINNTEYASTGNAELDCGLNVIEVKVTAEDGFSFKIYRFTILRDGDNNNNLSSLAFNGNAITLEDGVFSYKYLLAESDGSGVISAAAESENASLVISQNSKACDNGAVSLVNGSNLVYIVVTAETGSEPVRYALNIKLPDSTNALLESVTFSDNIKIDSVFGNDIEEYSATALTSESSLTAVAEETDAKIRVTVNGKVVSRGEGTVNGNFRLKNGENTVTISVTSPDGNNTRTYSYSINGTGVIYLSDLEWESNSVTGWGSLRKDCEVDGGALTLKDENGANVAFEKGIGAHADCDVYYDISGGNYTNFQAYVGVDASQNGRGTVQFRVLIDGVVVFSTDTLTSSSPMVMVDVEIPEGARLLQLKALKVENDGNDHADWADAKLLTPFDYIEEEEWQLGDVNHSGDITSADATMILQYFADILDENSEDFDVTLADVDSKGGITSADATLILQKFSDIIDEFPVNE